jgi:hypothetical protein
MVHGGVGILHEFFDRSAVMREYADAYAGAVVQFMTTYISSGISAGMNTVIPALRSSKSQRPLTGMEAGRAQFAYLSQDFGSVVNRRPGILLSILLPLHNCQASNPL